MPRHQLLVRVDRDLLRDIDALKDKMGDNIEPPARKPSRNDVIVHLLAKAVALFDKKPTRELTKIPHQVQNG